MQVDARTRSGAMLWQDDSPAPIADKVRRAAAFYEQKYGKKAVRCRMNMTTAGSAQLTDVDGIKIVIDGRILTSHLWVGD